METPPSVPEPEKMDRTRGLWKNLLYTFLGTTISIILTFGTSQLLQLHRQAQDRKMSALMVMGNIERFARSLDAVGEALAWRDTLATILLSIPMDSLDDPANTAYTDKAFLATAATVLSYDKTAEKIFSNSIETWKNMGNFQFIDNVGECFNSMAAIETDYAEYIDRLKEAQLRVVLHPDDYPGGSRQTKCLRDGDFRQAIATLHVRSGYYRYLAAYIRYKNKVNMELIGIGEEEVMAFVNQKREVKPDGLPEPYQQDYTTPKVDPNGIEDIAAWVETLHV